MKVTDRKFYAALCFAFLCTGSLFAQIESDVQDQPELKAQPVQLTPEDDLEVKALDAYIKAFTTRFFTREADFDDVRKLTEILSIKPDDPELSAFYFSILNLMNESDRAELAPRIKTILEQNPDVLILNLHAAEFLYTHNRVDRGLHYAKKSFELGLKGKSKDNMPEVIRLAAVCKYPLYCMALNKENELEQCMKQIRAVPELWNRAEIIALYSLTLTGKLEKRPPVSLPAYQDPDMKALRDAANRFLDRCEKQDKLYPSLDVMRIMPPLVARATSMQNKFADVLGVRAKKDPGLLLIVATMWISSDQPLKAAEAQKKLLQSQKKPSLPVMMRTLELYRANDRPEEALQLIKELGHKFSDQGPIIEEKIKIYSQMKQPRMALLETGNLPKGFDRYMQQSLILFDMKEYEEAYKRIQKAYAYALIQKINLKSIPFALLYAEMASKCHDMVGVKMILEPAVKANPRNAELLNTLGYTLADNNTDLEQAEKYIAEALKYLPDNAAILDSMAWVLYRRGKFAEAAKYMKKAIHAEKKKDISAEIWDHAGDIALAEGKKNDAIVCWKNALKAPGELNASAVLKKIEENSGK